MTSTKLQNIAIMATLLERMESRGRADQAAQYQQVAGRLRQALADADAGPELDALLAGHAGAARIYENLHYEHAGLCRSPLDAALAAELAARKLIEQVRRGTPAARDMN